jgi:hypothetical protein
MRLNLCSECAGVPYRGVYVCLTVRRQNNEWMPAGIITGGVAQADWTPLMWAASDGIVAVAQLLIRAGADVNAATTDSVRAGRRYRYCSIYDVALFAAPDLREHEAAHVFVAWRGMAGGCFLVCSTCQRQVRVTHLSEVKFQAAHTALTIACITGKAEMVKALLDARADVNLGSKVRRARVTQCGGITFIGSENWPAGLSAVWPSRICHVTAWAAACMSRRS